MERDATQQTEKQTSGTEQGSDKGMRPPSPETKQETDEKIEQHVADPQVTSARIKHAREQEKGGSRKKSKATRASLELITLTEGDLYDIGDRMWGVTMEALQQFEY